MTDYPRIYAPGSTWFFTVNLAERRNNYLLVKRLICWEPLFVTSRSASLTGLMPSLSCLIICIASGHCRLGTGIFPYAGICSKAIFPVPCRKAREFPQAGASAGNAVCGSAGSGRIYYVTKLILTIISITSIGILSSMAMYGKLPTGRIRVFTSLLSRVFTRWTGGIRVISIFM